MGTMVFTVWLGSPAIMPNGRLVDVGINEEVSAGCAVFKDVRPTLDAEFEVVDEKIEARPA